MNSFQDQPVFESLIESHNVNDILFLMEEIGDQLLSPMDLHLFAHEWKVVMEVMNVAMIRCINLHQHQEVALTLILNQLADVKLFQVFHPSKPASLKALAHHPTIWVVCIQVLKVLTLLLGIKPIAQVLVVCLCILMKSLSDAASSTSLKHQEHVRVSKKLQVNPSLFKAGLPSQSVRGVEVSVIKGVVF